MATQLESAAACDRLVDECLRCHDLCLAAVARPGVLPCGMREVLVELMRVCADACRNTACCMMSHDAERRRSAQACGWICEACGHALADTGEFNYCAKACLECGTLCLLFANGGSTIGQDLRFARAAFPFAAQA